MCYEGICPYEKYHVEGYATLGKTSLPNLSHGISFMRNLLCSYLMLRQPRRKGVR